jgi:hypothetical protein
LLEEEFRDCSIRYRAKRQEHAASIADRLAETADDVPAQLMQEYQDLWNDIFDYPDGQSPAVLTYEETRGRACLRLFTGKCDGVRFGVH